MVSQNKVKEVLKNASVVNEDGTPHIPTRLEKLDDWCFDHLWFYGFGYRIWKEYICPKAIYCMIKFFFQRRIRGFDDSETWDLDTQFYKWIYPRLKRFTEITMAYPMSYDNCKTWQKELNKRVKQLEIILNTCEFDFTDWSYIPSKELIELKKKDAWKSTINSTAFEYLIEDFNKWFAENVGQLWW